MNKFIRPAAFIAVAVTLHAAQTWWLSRIQPDISTTLAIRQLNGDAHQAADMRWFETEKNSIELVSAGILAITAVSLFGGSIWRFFNKQRNPARPMILPILLAGGLMTGCVRSYDTPEFASIDTPETGFLIPLEGDGKNQAKFASEEYLGQLKVAAKRVQIPHRWQQTGRYDYQGEWLPTVRLVKVLRSPITREWTADSGSGTSKKNEAIWIESSDSVSFSMGFTCTAFIPEEQAARFLYWYPAGSLAHVMDFEIRARIQQVAAEVAAKYPLDSLRARKQEVMDAVRKDVTAFFDTRGVTITTVGMFGGMTYENPEIQNSIDKTFIAQQEKVVNQARFEAQQRVNDRIELEANALAEKERRAALGQADAKRTIAAAEAQAIRDVNAALAATQQSPIFLQLKQLEVERARVEKWSGLYPQYYLAPSDKSGLLLQMPASK